MLRPRYIVVNQEPGWKIVRGGRRLPGDYRSKAQALCKAIAFAEQDGIAGRHAAVLVRHEDGRFVTEWVFGQSAHPDEAARPLIVPHPTPQARDENADGGGGFNAIRTNLRQHGFRGRGQSRWHHLWKEFPQAWF
jgi:hypothetical protein